MNSANYVSRRALSLVVACSLLAVSAHAELQNVQVGSHLSLVTLPELYDLVATPLFNGRDLSAWWIRSGDTVAFQVEDGKLVATGEGAHDWIFTDNEYGLFALGYEYRCVTGEGNSGVGIRAAKSGDPTFTGMEIQVIRPGWPVEWQRAGALYSTVPPANEADKAFGEWNSVLVYCNGDQIQTTLNGQVLYDIDTNDFTPETTKNSEWQKPLTDRAKRGHIAIQNHGDRVEFRNIKIVDFDAMMDAVSENNDE